MRLGINCIGRQTRQFVQTVGLGWAPNTAGGRAALATFPPTRRMLVSPTVNLDAVAVERLPGAWLGYSVDDDATPAEELDDVNLACIEGADLARAARRMFAVFPSFSRSLSHWDVMLPYCKMFTPRCNGLQAIGDSTAYLEHLVMVRDRRPCGTQLWGEVSTAPRGTPVTLRAALAWVRTFAPLVDGVWINSPADQYYTVAGLVAALFGRTANGGGA